MKVTKNQTSFLILVVLVSLSIGLFGTVGTGNSSTRASFLDSDKDGLSNDEESVYGTDSKKADSDGDGYMDGVEVKSGFDPLKPAPGDRIIEAKPEQAGGATADASGDGNLTRKVSDKLTEYIKENSKKEGDFGLEDVDTIIADTIEGQIGEEVLPEINPEAIKIKKQPYASLSEEERKRKEKEDAVEYLTALSYLAASNSPVEISSDVDFQNFSQEILNQAMAVVNGLSGTEYFDDLGDRGALFLSQLQEVEVPEKLVPLHVEGLQLATYTIELKSRTSVDPSDPMALLVSLTKVQKAAEKSYLFYEKIISELDKYGVKAE